MFVDDFHQSNIGQSIKRFGKTNVGQKLRRWDRAAGQSLHKFGQGAVGRSLKLGAMESFGWHVEGWGKNADPQGFLGRQNWGKDVAKGGIKGGIGGMAMRSIGLAATGYFMYQGYQEEGVWGATKEAAYSVAASAAFHYVGGAIASLGGGAAVAALGPLSLAAGVGLAGYSFGQAGRAHAKGLRQMEMGQSDQMQDAVNSQGAATMRQRSAAALSNSHLNGRMALGNEGFLMHRSFGS